MNNPYKALIWEQNRVAAVASGACLLTTVLLLFWLKMPPMGGSTQELAIGLIVLSLLGTGLVLLLRNDPEGHLITTFERRLARLPVATFGLVAIPLLARVVYLVMCCVVLYALYALLYGARMPAEALLLPVLGYLIAQAYTWSRRTLTGLEYVLPLALFLLPALMSFTMTLGERTYLESAQYLLSSAARPISFVVLSAGCVVLAFAGVYLERRDARVGLPTLREMLEWFAAREAAPAAPFASSEAAQLWYERRRSLRLLPVLSLVIFLALYLIALTLSLPAALANALPRTLPAFAFAITAAPASLAGIYAGSRYDLLRPQTSRNIARAKLLVTAEAICSTSALMAVCAVLAFVILAPAMMRLLLDARAVGEITTAGITVILFGPILCAALASWFLMSCRHVPMLTGAIILGAIFLFIVFAGLHAADAYSRHTYNFATSATQTVLIFGILLIPVYFSIRALKNGLCSWRGIALCLAAWIGLALFLWLCGSDIAPPAWSFLLCMALAGLLAASPLSLPVEVQRRRHS